MTKWRKIKIGIFIFSFVTGLLSALNKPATQAVRLEWFDPLIPLIFFSIALPLAIGIQSKAPYINEKWVRPTLDTNFLTLGDPLHFFHLGSFVFLIGGLATLFASIIQGSRHIMEGIMLLSCGVGVFIGVKVCSKVCAFKY